MSGDRGAGGGLQAGFQFMGFDRKRLSPDDCLQDLHITNLRGCDREKVVAEQDHVGELAGRD